MIKRQRLLSEFTLWKVRFLFLLNYCIYLLSKCFPYFLVPTLHLRGNSPTHLLGQQVCTGLGASLLTEARQSSQLIYMCLEPWTSPCMLFGCWLSKFTTVVNKLLIQVCILWTENFRMVPPCLSLEAEIVLYRSVCLRMCRNLIQEKVSN